MPTTTLTSRLVLSLVGSAEPVTLALKPPGPLRIGRRSGHDLVIPDPASRDHCMLVYDDDADQWFIVDTDSKHGTRLNGVALQSGQKYPLRERDLIEIRPWTLQLLDAAGDGHDGSTLLTKQDAESVGTRIDRFDQQEPHLASERLSLLLRSAKAIHAAEDEEALAEAVLDAIASGTGYANVALLRPVVGDEMVDVIGSRGSICGATEPRLSRSLIRCACKGESVRLTDDHVPANGASIAALGIEQAMCLPLMLGDSPAGFLYMDNRQCDAADAPFSQVAPDAAAFAAGVAQIASMATANLRRMDLERRLARMDADLAAAAEAQRWMLPQRRLCVGRYCCTGVNRPGKTVSGDFFDMVQLDEHRFALSLGDVVGKGIAASVLMTATQGFLHAALFAADDPCEAVTRLNHFLVPRCDGRRFVTLWVGVFDTSDGTLRYVDAGHGYGMHFRGETVKHLRDAGGPPVGIDTSSMYGTAQLDIAAGDRVVLVSDGLVEQIGHAANGAAATEFGVDNVVAAVAGDVAGEDAIANLFRAVILHAGTDTLSDDATAAIVEVQP